MAVLDFINDMNIIDNNMYTDRIFMDLSRIYLFLRRHVSPAACFSSDSNL